MSVRRILNLGDQYRRGKLQEARNTVEELFRIYEHNGIRKELRTAFKALDRADAILTIEINKLRQETAQLRRYLSSCHKKRLRNET